jgi:zinc/manganese transport system substrate-binding protein
MNIFKRTIYILAIAGWYCPFLMGKSPVIVCTNTILANITSEIAPNHYKIHSLVPADSDPHTYESTASDLRLIASAECIIMNGLKLEGWIEKLIKNSGYSGQLIIATQLIPEKGILFNPEDPHAWMHPINGIVYVEYIASELMKFFPEDGSKINARKDSYALKLTQLHEEIVGLIEKIPPQNRILITTHDAFRYFTIPYGLRSEPLMGVSTEADVQIRDILRISNLLKKEKIPTVFAESTIHPKVLMQLAADFDVLVSPPLYSDALSDSSGPAPSYLDLIKHNATVISYYLSEAPSFTSQQSFENIKPLSWADLFIVLGVFIGGFAFLCMYIKK